MRSRRRLRRAWRSTRAAACSTATGAPIAGLYAVGDVTEESSYTHSANYQARIVADEVTGRGHDADYVAIPRAVYVDPAVLLRRPDARAGRASAGIDVRTAGFDVGEVERAALLRGLPTAAGPTECRAAGSSSWPTRRPASLVGASCVGPEADSWGAELALAVRARLDVRLLAEHVRAFPTWSEAVYPAAAELAQ